MNDIIKITFGVMPLFGALFFVLSALYEIHGSTPNEAKRYAVRYLYLGVACIAAPFFYSVIA